MFRRTDSVSVLKDGKVLPVNLSVQKVSMEKNVNPDVNVEMEDIVTQQQVIAHAHQVSMVITVRKHVQNGCLDLYVDKDVLVKKETPCIVNLEWAGVCVNLDGME